MITLERRGNEVYHAGTKLSINPQASKGPGNEVVNISGVEGSNGKKWMSLSKIQEGTHDYDAAPRSGGRTTSNKFVTPSYTLTSSEQNEVTRLEQEKQKIINRAIERTKFLSRLSEPDSIPEEDREAAIERLQKIVEELKKG